MQVVQEAERVGSMSLRYLSVCSGIEAATVAWHPLGWTAVGFAEIRAGQLARVDEWEGDDDLDLSDDGIDIRITVHEVAAPGEPPVRTCIGRDCPRPKQHGAAQPSGFGRRPPGR